MRSIPLTRGMIPWEDELDDLLKAESGLTAWEIDFCESLDKQRGRSITDKQLNTLHGIWDRVCG